MQFTGDDSRVRSICTSISGGLWTEADAYRRRNLEIARELYPVAARGFEDNVSGRRQFDNEDLLATSWGQEMLKQGAAGFSINLMSPARPWFELGCTLPLDKSIEHAVKVGLEKLTAVMREAVETSGGYRCTDKLFEHILAFGTACMLVFYQPTKNYSYLNFMLLRPGTYALGIGANGMVNRVSRKFEFTLNQLVEEFGTQVLDDASLDEYKRGAGIDKRIEVTNLIEPIGEPAFDDITDLCDLDPKRFAYRSIYWADFGHGNQNDTPLLAVRGIRHNPIIAPRLDCEEGDVWGRGRGIDALPISRALCQFREDTVDLSGNMANPPLFVDASLQGQPLDLGRGSLQFWNSQAGIQPTVPAIPTTGNANWLDATQADLRNELSKIFFVDRFATIYALKDNPGVKTATEVNQIVREAMGLLGPVVTRLAREFQDRLVGLMANITLDWDEDLGTNLFTELGPIIRSGDMRIYYVGEIHASMKASNLTAIERFLALAGTIVQMSGDPSALDLINLTNILRTYGDSLGIKESDLNSQKVIDSLKKMREQLQSQANQLEMLKTAAGAVKDGGAGYKAVMDAQAGKQTPGGGTGM